MSQPRVPTRVAAARPGDYGPGRALALWNPEDDKFWLRHGRRVAWRNLGISAAALTLAFAIWMLWSVIVVNLPRVGFRYSTVELFWLAAAPGLSGATLRLVYTFLIPLVGGRRWTAISTFLLLIPAIGVGLAIRAPDTPYGVLLAVALLCGFGGGNFASSMANIGYFFPRRDKGLALGLNAGIGNLGICLVQAAIPLAITVGLFGALGGEPAVPLGEDGDKRLWLQNAGFVWVPFILLAGLAAWFGMNDLVPTRGSLAAQLPVLWRSNCWILSALYGGTFGSFVGLAAAFPLLAWAQTPAPAWVDYSFLGPLAGALARAATGWLGDRIGGARVTAAVFGMMILLALLLLDALGSTATSIGFWWFFVLAMLLFVATGIGNASVFQMVPGVMLAERRRVATAAGRDDSAIRGDAERDAGVVLGTASAVAAYGAFVIPIALAASVAATGGPRAALLAFIAYYLLCLWATWWFYLRGDAPATEPPPAQYRLSRVHESRMRLTNREAGTDFS